MNLIKSKGGYFYKIYKNGKKKRISKDEYIKIIKKNKIKNLTKNISSNKYLQKGRGGNNNNNNNNGSNNNNNNNNGSNNGSTSLNSVTANSLTSEQIANVLPPNRISFDIQNVLGKGSQGTVQQIRLTETLSLNNGDTVLESGKIMAIKIIKRTDFQTNRNGILEFRTFRQELEREYLLLSPLLRRNNYSHKNIMNIYKYCNYRTANNEIVFILLEYLNGKSLETELQEKEKDDFIIDTIREGRKKIRQRNFNRFRGDVSLNINDFKNIFMQCITGLNYLHTNGIIHRDIKPDNIMICRNVEEVTAKIIDFGHACNESEDNTYSCRADIFGTNLYVPNTSSFNCKYLDIYSLGIIGLRYFFPGIINPRYISGEYLNLKEEFKLFKPEVGNFDIFSIYHEFLELIGPLIKLIIEMLSKDRNLIINPDNPLNSVNANDILFKQVNVPGNAPANAPAIAPGNVPGNAAAIAHENDGGANEHENEIADAPAIETTNVGSGGKKIVKRGGKKKVKRGGKKTDKRGGKKTYS